MKILCLLSGINKSYSIAADERKISAYFGPHANLTLFSFQKDNPAVRSFFEACGYKVMFGNVFSDDRGNRGQKLLHVIGAIFRVLWEVRNVDVVFSFGSHSFVGVLAWMAAKMMHKPNICRVNGHGMVWRGQKHGLRVQFQKLLVRRMFMSSSLVVFNSQSLLDDEINIHDLTRRANHIIIAPGVDEKLFSQGVDDMLPVLRDKLGISQTDFVVGMVVTGRPVKNIELLIRALPILVARGISAYLVLVGDFRDDIYKSELNTLAERLGVTDRYIKVGPKENTDLYAWYRMFDVTALTSRHEAFGLSITESFLCGTPCVGTNVTGIKEQIIHNASGFLFDTEDEHEAADYLVRLASSQSLRAEFAEVGRQFVLSHFTMAAVAAQFKKALATVCP